MTDINSIYNKIIQGVGSQQLTSDYQLSYSKIYKLAKKLNILDDLKKNNKLNKKQREFHRVQIEHNCINNQIDKLWGNTIIQLIQTDKYTTNDLKNKIGRPIKQIIRYLKYKDLYDICIRNGKDKIGSLAKVNGRCSIIKLKGVEFKPITEEIANRFCELKRILIYKQKVYDAITQEFEFGDKKIKQLCEKYGYPQNNPQTGILNPMYGKSPSKNSGIGVKCHIHANGVVYFCRSTLELKIFLYLIENNIKFHISKHRVKYKINGVDKTYCPDIVIDDYDICEIKPTRLISLKINIAKFAALKKYCVDFNLKCKYLTECDFDLSKYNIQIIDEMINKNIIIIDVKNLEKLKRNI